MKAGRWIYIGIGAAAAGAMFAAAMLLMNINERKHEALESYVEVARLTEDTIDPAVWAGISPANTTRSSARPKWHPRNSAAASLTHGWSATRA